MRVLAALEKNGKIRREYMGKNSFVYLLDGDFHKDDGDGQGGFVYCNIDLLDDGWQPFPEEKEIRPEGPGETWEYDAKFRKIFTFTNNGLELSAIDEAGRIITIAPFMIHGKNGFTRVEPPVEDESVKESNIVRMITDDEINVICDVLGESIQFYSIHGSHANPVVLHEIAKVLTEITKDKNES